MNKVLCLDEDRVDGREAVETVLDATVERIQVDVELELVCVVSSTESALAAHVHLDVLVGLDEDVREAHQTVAVVLDVGIERVRLEIEDEVAERQERRRKADLGAFQAPVLRLARVRRAQPALLHLRLEPRQIQVRLGRLAEHLEPRVLSGELENLVSERGLAVQRGLRRVDRRGARRRHGVRVAVEDERGVARVGLLGKEERDQPELAHRALERALVGLQHRDELPVALARGQPDHVEERGLGLQQTLQTRLLVRNRVHLRPQLLLEPPALGHGVLDRPVEQTPVALEAAEFRVDLRLKPAKARILRLEVRPERHDVRPRLLDRPRPVQADLERLCGFPERPDHLELFLTEGERVEPPRVLHFELFFGGLGGGLRGRRRSWTRACHFVERLLCELFCEERGRPA